VKNTELPAYRLIVIRIEIQKRDTAMKKRITILTYCVILMVSGLGFCPSAPAAIELAGNINTRGGEIEYTTAVGDVLYFRADDGEHGIEPVDYVAERDSIWFAEQ
jgi:hypothetical protein